MQFSNNIQNQMQEALMLFESICNSQWFIKTSIILFLNKIDLFRAKIAHSPVKKYFPDYHGERGNFKAASAFFEDNFRRLNRNPNKVRNMELLGASKASMLTPLEQDIYVHFTNATDTNLLKITMQSVQDMILQKNLQTLVL